MHSESKLVAVTGGSGFIGSHLIQSLLAENYYVRALARSPQKIQYNHPNLEILHGDLHIPAALNEFVSDAEFIIHCAGRVRGRTQDEFKFDNVIGTQNLINACTHSANATKFLYISSLAARESQLSYYAHSKFSAENLVKNIDFSKWSIIRPPAVYGPNDTELLPLFRWMKRGVLWIPVNPNQQFSLLHVSDLVDLIILVLSIPISNTIIEPDDGYHYDWNSIANIGTSYFKRKIHKITIPALGLHSVAQLNVILSKLVGYSPILTPSKMKELTHDNWLSSGIGHDFSWSAKVDLNQGLSTLYL